MQTNIDHNRRFDLYWPFREVSARCYFIVICLAVLVGGMSGCGKQTIIQSYGQSTGINGKKSVNGLGALRSIYSDAGFRCYTATSLTRSTKKMQVIIWAPDTPEFPSVPTMTYLESWLAEKDNRTLVFIGRDFDAAVDYWNQMADKVSPDQVKEARKRQAMARATHDALRVQMPKNHFSRWFSFDRDAPLRRVNQFDGPWGAELADSDDSRIFIQGEFKKPYRNTSVTVPDEYLAKFDYGDYSGTIPTPADQSKWANEYIDSEWDKRTKFETLLTDQDGNALVIKLTKSNWNNSQIIAFVNGSMLLNASLVSHQNRAIAGKLLEASGTPGPTAFLATSTGDVRIRDVDDSTLNRKGLEFLTVWPLNLIVMHAALAGIIICFALMPIFGRGKKLTPRPVSDFGQHVEALGQMLARTGNRGFALRQIAEYFRVTKKEPTHPWAQFEEPKPQSSDGASPFATAVNDKAKSEVPSAANEPASGQANRPLTNPYADPPPRSDNTPSPPVPPSNA